MTNKYNMLDLILYLIGWNIIKHFLILPIVSILSKMIYQLREKEISLWISAQIQTYNKIILPKNILLTSINHNIAQRSIKLFQSKERYIKISILWKNAKIILRFT